MSPKSLVDQQNLIKLLQKLGGRDVKYPPELLAQQRIAFLDKAASIKLNVDLKAGKGSGGMASSGSEIFLQSFLAIVLIVEIAIGAYVLRDAWLPLLKNPTPTPVYLQPLPVNLSTPIPLPSVQITESIIFTEPPVFIGTAAPVETAIPVAPDQNLSVTEETQQDDRGKHLGQTPGAPEAPGQDKDK